MRGLIRSFDLLSIQLKISLGMCMIRGYLTFFGYEPAFIFSYRYLINYSSNYLHSDWLYIGLRVQLWLVSARGDWCTEHH